MTNELIDMHNRITTEELDRLVRNQLIGSFRKTNYEKTQA